MVEPLDVWVEKNAIQLKKDFQIHIEVLAELDPESEASKTLVRMLLISVRQWARSVSHSSQNTSID